jgi:copper transport protein
VIRVGAQAALALALVAGEALGHAVLVASQPADGAVVDQAPAEVVLRFNEPVVPTAAHLFHGSGRRVPLAGAPMSEGDRVRIELPIGLADGRYVLSYRVTSADSHPIGGAMTFAVGRGVAAPPPALASETPPDDWARLATRIVHDLALLIAAGGALYALLVARFPHERAVLLVAAAIATATALAGVALQGAALLGGDGAFMDTAVWRIGASTTRGRSAGAAAAGALAIAAGALTRSMFARTWLLAAGSVLLAASPLLSGHAATARPQALALPALAVHLLAAAFWAGSLVALLATLREARPPASAPALRRFSRLAVVAVPALVVAAVPLVAIQTGSVRALGASAYGAWILTKATLLGGLLALAAWNRLRLLPALERGEPAAAGRLRKSIGAELALIACAAGAAAILAQTPPPRSAVAAAPGVVTVLETGEHAARLTIAPARPGFNAVAIAFRTATGAAFDPAEVSITFANPDAGVEAIVRHPRRLAPGSYALEGSELAFPGEWAIEIRARVTDFDEVVLRTRVALR